NDWEPAAASKRSVQKRFYHDAVMMQLYGDIEEAPSKPEFVQVDLRTLDGGGSFEASREVVESERRSDRYFFNSRAGK
ncbi:hypothetical protein AAVH_37676, partial [Aphelenchoides avenae]